MTPAERDEYLVATAKMSNEIADQIASEGTYTISDQLFVYRKGVFRRFEP